METKGYVFSMRALSRPVIFILCISLLGALTGCAGLTPFTKAASIGNIEAVRTMLDSGADVNEKGGYGRTALLWAAYHGHADIVRILLDAGADVNEKGDYGGNPLGSAAYKGHADIVRILLDAGADVNTNAKSGEGTPLHGAALYGHTDIVRILLDAGADVNAKSWSKATPLYFAASHGYTDIVHMLLDAGADPGIANNEGKTPLRIAQEEGHTTIARMLKEAEEERYMAAKKQPSYQPPSVTKKPSVKSDVDVLPLVMAKLKKNAYAVVIGVEKYRQKLPKADFADNDARIMVEYLTKVMGYPEENIVMLINDRALKSDLEKYIGKWLPNNVEKDSAVFIYYSGHGAPNPKTGDAYLVPYDGDPSFIEETGYPLKRLYAKLDRLQAKEIIVVLDSCFSGAGGRSVLAKGARPLVMNMDKQVFHSDRIAILTASSGSQISSTHDKKGHGLFTYFLLKGIKEGNTQLGTLYNYLKPQVEKIARKTYNNEQTPGLIAPKWLLNLRLYDR